MARCYCPCHSYPGTYRHEPCSVCGHFHSEGAMVGGYRDGWEQNPKPVPPDPQELPGRWTVYFLSYQTGRSWLVGENIASSTEALRRRNSYLAAHPDLAPCGQAYVVAPAEPWPACPGCTEPMVKCSGVPVCATDRCAYETSGQERDRIARTVKALADPKE